MLCGVDNPKQRGFVLRFEAWGRERNEKKGWIGTSSVENRQQNDFS